MTNPNDPITYHLTYNQCTGKPDGQIEGLTKREYFAALALQGMLAYDRTRSADAIARWSVEAADALINELNRNI